MRTLRIPEIFIDVSITDEQFKKIEATKTKKFDKIFIVNISHIKKIKFRLDAMSIEDEDNTAYVEIDDIDNSYYGKGVLIDFF